MSRSWICMVLWDWTTRLPNQVQGRETHSGSRLRPPGYSLARRHVLLWLLSAFAEEIGIHLLHDELLVLFLPGLQAVFVEQHLHVFLPLLPCQLGDVVVDALPEFAIERRLVEAFHFAAHLDALHHVCHSELPVV